jgi:hypothetical protein
MSLEKSDIPPGGEGKRVNLKHIRVSPNCKLVLERLKKSGDTHENTLLDIIEGRAQPDSDILEGYRGRGEGGLKDIKVSEHCKTLLKEAKKSSESYSDTLYRLIELQQSEPVGIELVNGGSGHQKSENFFSSLEGDVKKITPLLDFFGLKPSDIGVLIKQNQKLEAAKLRALNSNPMRIGRSIIDVAKIAGTITICSLLVWQLPFLVGLFIK